MREHLVVGAGISGLWAALLLARRGARVRVIERAPQIGGLAGAETFRGVPCDLGSHRLHPTALREPLFREMDAREPFLRRPRRGVLLFDERRIPYPPRALDMLRALGLRASASLALGLIQSPARRRAFARWDHDRAQPDEDLGFERFVRERVGEPAYQAFYRPYAEKVWGLPARELSQSVAKKRVSTTAPWKLVESVAGRALRAVLRDREDALDGFVYPARGASAIVAYLERELARHGVGVERGVAFDLRARPEITLFAGDLRDLSPTTLEHRGLYLVYLAFPIERAGEAETYYAPDRRFWFGRVSEPQNYAPSLRRAGETILTVEIPEGQWGRGEDFASGARLEELGAQLARAGIIPRGLAPIEARQRFLPSVYPLYRRGWRAAHRVAMDRVAALGDVFPFGRQALFLHVNLDHCAAIAEQVVDHVLAGRDARSWITHAERFLELRVRD